MSKILNIDLEIIVHDDMTNTHVMRVLADIIDVVDAWIGEDSVDSHSYGFRPLKED